MLEPKHVFLPLEGLGDASVFRAPVRSPGTIEPLIDGLDALSTIERDLARAKDSIMLAVWSFDPDLPLVSKQQRNELPTVEAILRDRKSSIRPATWGDLLISVAELGVAVRVLISDFDPVFSTDHHRRSWAAFRRLHRRLSAGSVAANNLQVIVSYHGAQASPAILVQLAERQTSRIDALIKGLNTTRVNKGHDAAVAELAETPGLWEVVTLDAKKRFQRLPDVALPIRVGAHHLKVCVVDDHTAFIGGLDPEAGRVDTPRHLSPRTSWHDVHLRIKGPHVEDVLRSFQGLWATDSEAFEARVARINAIHDALKLPVQRFGKPAVAEPTDDGRPDEITGRTAQVLKTQSVSGGLVSRVPSVVRDDIEQFHRRAIAAAEDFVYLENQYIRWPAIADWLITRRKERPRLQVIFVVPVAPEEVTAKGKMDELTAHGLFLQRQIFERVSKSFGADFAGVSLVRNQRATKEHATNAHGSFQVYVHSKLMIVDDRVALISTANANGRGFRVDTEIALGWFDPAEVLALRRKLWAELLGTVSFAEWKPEAFAAQWSAAAKKNAAAVPGKREGLVVPHRLRPGTDQSIPEEYADLFDVEASFPTVV
jgi:phosphatidylserine/phosphatidylglycerophosphate/cardiolipin synthase-like enzyme